MPGGVEYRLAFAARSFLHNQVRSMVGTLERVGAGAWAPGCGRCQCYLKVRGRTATHIAHTICNSHSVATTDKRGRALGSFAAPLPAVCVMASGRTVCQ